MPRSDDANPYSPPASDPERLPEAAVRYKFAPSILWFVPGCAVGFLMIVAIKDGTNSVAASLNRQPIDSLVFFLSFGTICLLVSCAWRILRFRSILHRRPSVFARILGGCIMGFCGVGIIRILETNKILGPPSIVGWIFVIGIFAAASIPAIEVEYFLARLAAREKIDFAGRSEFD
ncbi:MAG: hypothetical protein KDB00_23235 [Planctomycetales bacterium]|nr:hypothetical protein [Planctomycetales bacterium]